jgi:hypothetical protein
MSFGPGGALELKNPPVLTAPGVPQIAVELRQTETIAPTGPSP